jgi:hypothetical protein
MISEKTRFFYSQTVIEVLGEYADYSVAIASGALDANCVKIVAEGENYYAVPFGRINGVNYEEEPIGPFKDFLRARNEAESILEDAE